MTSRSVVFAEPVRTAIGTFGGSLKDVPAPDLGAAAIRAAVARSFARTWTTDLKQRRIRVNAISPGSIDTPGLDKLLGSAPAGKRTPQHGCDRHAARPVGHGR